MGRKICGRLLRWETETAPETAPLIEGARRVGKSWIAEEFARREYRSFVLVDFIKVSQSVVDVFKNGLEDLDGPSSGRSPVGQNGRIDLSGMKSG